MGISGLLPILKGISTNINIKDYAGKTLAVDAYVWLHRGAYGCAEELATGVKTVKYVNYAMFRVRMLKHYGVTPLIVFDGGLLPSKMGTEDARERRRNDAKAKGNQLLAEGKKTQARDAFVKAVDVTPEMAYQLIKALRREGIQYIVAPYEADAQLAYLDLHGLVDGIITEDSDLLIFGCKAVLFKLDASGNCVQILRDDFASCREHDFSGWGAAQMRGMAVLSGCDYLKGIKGIGLKKAHKLMRKYKTVERVIQAIRLDNSYPVPHDYLALFRQAELTFLHQRVFDPVSKTLVHLTPLPEGLTSEDIPFAGAAMEEEYARKLALGDIDPITKLPMIDIFPGAFSPTKTQYQPSSFKTTKTTKAKVAGPVTGKGSLFNWFSVATPTPPISRPKFSAKGKGKEREEKENVNVRQVVMVEKVVKSKFFGGPAVGCSKNQEVETGVMELSSDEDEFPDDEPTEYPDEDDYEEVDEDAEAALHDLDSPMSSPHNKPVVEVKREGSFISSACGISSPASTPPRAPRRQSKQPKWDTFTDEGISSPSVSGFKGEDDVVTEEEEEQEEEEQISSPTTLPAIGKRRREASLVKIETEVKGDRIAPRKVGGRVVHISSDPIEGFTESTATVDDGIEEASTPSDKKGKGRVYDQTPAAGRVKKERVLEMMIEDEVEEEELPTVAAGWRAKFMLPMDDAAQTPRQPTSAARRSLPTPSTSLPVKSLAARKPSLLASRSKSFNTPRAQRLPLSPKSRNVVAARVFLDTPSQEQPVITSSQEIIIKREKVVVTSARLLAFKYSGVVSRE